MNVDVEVNPSLLDAFLATDYCVETDAGERVITIGATHAELDRALDHRDWHLVSAHNPDARLLDPVENDRRHRQLLERIRNGGIDSWPAVNRSFESDWPDEPGRLLAGASTAWIHACARAFGQAAVVAGQAGQPARLWVYRSDRLPEENPHLIRIDR